MNWCRRLLRLTLMAPAIFLFGAVAAFTFLPILAFEWSFGERHPVAKARRYAVDEVLLLARFSWSGLS